jgi:predicted extracellular nuclease
VIAIRELQGEGAKSPYAGQTVTVRGVVTGVLRRGFFVQSANQRWDEKSSNAIFVYSPDWTASRGSDVEVTGKVTDYVKHETAKPVTQIRFESSVVHASNGPVIQPIDFDQLPLAIGNDGLAKLLNSLEGMLVSIAAGQTFIAPSNKFGDYVLALDGDRSFLRSQNGGAITSTENPLRWFPGFRITNYNHAQRLNVGAKLTSRVQGPLNYRVDSYQIALSDPFKVEPSFINLSKSSLEPEAGAVTIMTLNCFNLDPHVESESQVVNPRQDVDDDWGEGRFHTLAHAVVLQANIPDIVALQEIQDNDGAEISETVDASSTYELLIRTIEKISGVRYQWVDVAPLVGQDGGQPGGNIRNGYLYNPQRVQLLAESVRTFGNDEECYEGSRKPLVCEFLERGSGQKIAVINVHLASKRHQESIFAPNNAGVDAKLSVRVEQAESIRRQTDILRADGIEFYVTGDFNDTEHSPTLQALTGDHNVNLVMLLPEIERYDYNHRGKLQVLMHGVVDARLAESRAEYEIIHGNELIGIMPGEESDKPSDHAYVIAKLHLAKG